MKTKKVVIWVSVIVAVAAAAAAVAAVLMRCKKCNNDELCVCEDEAAECDCCDCECCQQEEVAEQAE